MGQIDVRRHVAEMEQVLRGRDSLVRRLEALAVLERWQWDEMLDSASRKRARQLVREFGSGGEHIEGAGAWAPPSLPRAPVQSAAAPADDNAAPAVRSALRADPVRRVP
jgi:hypothetical protein